MKDINEIAAKLQEYGYETEIYNNFVIGLINKETTARGRIFLIEKGTVLCSLRVDMFDDDVLILDHKRVSLDSLDQVLPIYEETVTTMKKIKSSAMNFINNVSTSKPVQDCELFDKYLEHFKGESGSRTGNLLNIVGIFGALNIYLSDNLELTVTLLYDNSRKVIYSNYISNENYKRVFSEVDSIIAEFGNSCGTISDIYGITECR